MILRGEIMSEKTFEIATDELGNEILIESYPTTAVQKWDYERLDKWVQKLKRLHDEYSVQLAKMKKPVAEVTK